MTIVNQIDTSVIYTSALLSILDNIQLTRTNSTYTVPIVYGDRTRLYKKIHDNNKVDNMENVIQLPAMSLSYDTLTRNLERQTNRMLKNTIANIDETNVRLNWNDSAFDFDYTVVIIAKTMTEMTNIVGYILSSFKNGLFYVDVNLPLYTVPVSTPIVLNSAEPDINSNGEDYGSNRTIEATLNFTIKGLIHNNVESTSPLITQIQLNQYINETLEMKTLVKTDTIS